MGHGIVLLFRLNGIIMITLDEIKQKVEKSGNLLTISMEHLREAHGAGRLGSQVRQDISRKLAEIGLGHIPTELPSYQQEFVRLYKRGTAIGELIEQVLHPGEQNDRILVERFGQVATDYATIVQKIRELVVE